MHSIIVRLAPLALLFLAHTARAISFDLPPGKIECFFEDVHQGTTINGAYAVTQGSHMDIDVNIFSPDNKQIYNAKREGEDKFQLKADRDGTYRFCFSNKMSMVSHKTVKLAITTGEPIDFSKLAKKESIENVERWVVSIAHTVRMVDFHQQEYRMIHDRHLNTVSTTNRRVKWWCFLECISVMIVSAVQVIFIKRMFNKSMPGVKRMV